MATIIEALEDQASAEAALQAQFEAITLAAGARVLTVDDINRYEESRRELMNTSQSLWRDIRTQVERLPGGGALAQQLPDAPFYPPVAGLTAGAHAGGALKGVGLGAPSPTGMQSFGWALLVLTLLHPFVGTFVAIVVAPVLLAMIAEARERAQVSEQMLHCRLEARRAGETIEDAMSICGGELPTNRVADAQAEAIKDRNEALIEQAKGWPWWKHVALWGSLAVVGAGIFMGVRYLAGNSPQGRAIKTVRAFSKLKGLPTTKVKKIRKT